MADFGKSFLPGSEDNNGREFAQNGGAPSGLPPLQSAIRLLSLKLPRFGGQGLAPGAIAPGALLQGAGGAGLGAGGGLEAVLRALFGIGGMGQAGPMMPGPLPGPRIQPGGEHMVPPPGRSFQPGPVEPVNTGEQPPDLFRPPSLPTIQPSGPTAPPQFGPRPPFSQMY